ncbi:Transaldolase [Kingella potus]|uniref:Transaldolase n=1 Tax=Kingella potus TaxID=265175 RepID=A0A377R263_9NEIS|nr:transaldolase [Kingella potus]UOP01144.1 transaldolase [Kingella potus]STR00848.1 Transaldolase [Kingella potus]
MKKTAILSDVKNLGQQIWLDNLSRSLVDSGTLAQMLRQGVCGVTSNPAIFRKAFAADPLYAEQIAALKRQNLTAKQRYETLAAEDVRAACAVCMEEYRAGGGEGGFVSWEVSPELAHDAAGTVSEAKRLYEMVGCENLMVKVPATDAGLCALETLVSDGLNVNLTLLFSRRQTVKAYEAYVRGIRARLDAGKSVSSVRVVASFFISRIDSALDDTLPAPLRGQTAVALAKAAYADCRAFFAADGFAGLARQGAHPVRLLWASTGVKNPAYPDTLYVDSLIGRDTVNTVPDATLAAFADHGTARATLAENTAAAFAQLDEVSRLGIDLEALAARLQNDGLQQFDEAFAQLLELLA